MKMNRNLAVISATSTLAVTLACLATPAMAAERSSAAGSADSTTVTIFEEQVAALSPADAAVASEVDALVAGVDQTTSTYDERLVPAEIAQSADGLAFAAEFARSGGSVVSRDGTTTREASPDQARSAAAARGRIWQDAWGAHMTVPSATMDRLSTLAATGSGAAGAVAALLAANIEGFPISTTGALASGAVAVGLISAAGALQLCNINGKGAQVNYNWVTWTCWPL
jgi:hypothetical protein